MKQKESLRREIRAALEPTVRPAPQLAEMVIAHVKAEAAMPQGRIRPMLQGAAVLVGAALVAVLVITLHQAATRSAQGPGPAASTMPVAVGPGANVAWLQGENGFMGVDPQGHIVGRIPAPALIRSVDGDELYAVRRAYVDVYSAGTGSFERRITRQGGPVPEAAGTIDGNVSPDGRYLAIANVEPGGGLVELIDLKAGRSMGEVPLIRTLLAPGSPVASEPVVLLVAPNATRIYVFANLWASTTMDVIAYDGTALRIIASAGSGQPGHTLPSCNGMGATGPAVPIRLLPDGKAIASFCPGDGTVSWFDVSRLTITKQIAVPHANPFWVSPVFSRDGSILVLHEGGTGRIEVIDLQRRAIVHSTRLTAAASLDPFSWLADRLFPPAYAGGIPRSAALSADGSRLYAISIFGGPGSYWVVHLPDLRVLNSTTAPDAGGEIWLSGDGNTVYLLNNGGTELSVLHSDGSRVATITLASTSSDFLQ
jgi:DNA-binding beta-propeller fold protein YncE